MKIVFTPPTKDQPGYLRRTRKALELQRKLKGSPEPETVDELVDFLAPFITEPSDPEQAKSALWDASEAQFLDLLARMQGGNEPAPLA